MMMPVDPERMTLLIRDLSEPLEPIGIQLQSTIKSVPPSERVSATLEGLVSPDCSTQRTKVWTWGEVAQEFINYGQKYGPVNSKSLRPMLKDPCIWVDKAIYKNHQAFGQWRNRKKMTLVKLLGGRDIIE